MYRDAEKHYLLALDFQPTVDIYLYLARVYLRFDQPLASIKRLQEGLEKFPLEPFLVQAISRIHEVNLNEKNIHPLFLKKFSSLGS